MKEAGILGWYGDWAVIVALLCVFPMTAAAAPYRLSSQSQAALDRLGTFDEIESRDWIYHEGKVANGEGLELAPVDWKPVTLPFTGSKGEVWLRTWIQIPKDINGYDLRGSAISFEIEVGREGPGRGYLYETIYFDGKRIAEGTHLDAQTLTTQGITNKILVAIHMPASASTKHFERVHLRIHYRLDRPDPSRLRAEIVSAAQVLPVLTRDATVLTGQEKTLEGAVQAIDTSALNRGDQQAFDASLEKAQLLLEPLRPALKECLVRLVGNAHIDAAWLWTSTETVDQVHFTFANALQMMDEYPSYVFSQSSAQYYEWMEEKFPDLFAEIQERVREGRWEIVGGMWVEPDLNMPDGESQVRQLLIGKRYFKNKFDVDVTVGWNPDSFGFNWQLPQIYKKSGINYFITQKLHYNETNQLPLRLFWWQSPDGSRVLTYFPHDYVQDINPIEVVNDVSRMAEHNPGQTELMHLYGPSLGRLAVAATRETLDRGKRWSDPDAIFPATRFSTAQEFFKDMSNRVEVSGSPVWNYTTFAHGDTRLSMPLPGKISLPIWDDEMYLELHRGTYTTQSKQKTNMRHSEEQLLSAERFAALGWLGGLNYPAGQLTKAWKRKSFNDFHDVAAGTGVAAIYKDAENDYDMIRSITSETTRVALEEIESRIDTNANAGVPIVVWNPLSWNRTDVVSVSVEMPAPSVNTISVLDAEGRAVLMQILLTNEHTNTYQLLLRPNVPSIGYTVLHVLTASASASAKSDLSLNGTTMENAALRVTVNPRTGCITSLYDKLSKFDSIAAGKCGNMLQAFVDDAPVEDAWNIVAGYDKSKAELTIADSVEVTEKGPLRATIRVTRTWNKSKFVQDITLYAGLPRVDVFNTVDWHESHVLLKASFPLPFISRFATYEIPFGSIERPTTRTNSLDGAKFEVPALRWADLGDEQHGFSLINEAKYGYDAKDSELRLSLLRSSVYPDPAADRGVQQFSYSLYPHVGTWKRADTVLRAYEFNYKLFAHQSFAHEGALPPSHSFVSVEPHNLVLTAMKKSEEGNSLVLRFYEWAGEQTTGRISVPAGASAAAETNLLEGAMEHNNAHLSASRAEVDVNVGPYSINTLRIDYPKLGEEFWRDQEQGIGRSIP